MTSTTPGNFNGWVLAGGQSRRMRQDKALLKLDSQPLALHAAQILAPFVTGIAIVGDPAKYTSLGFPVTPDLRPDCGPLAGIEAALAATDSDWNLILACDLPGITEALLKNLLLAASPGTDAPDAVIPRHPDNNLEPLCALYRRRALPVIQAALNAGIRKVTDAIAPLTLRYLPVADSRPFNNLNTPEDLQLYRLGLSNA